MREFRQLNAWKLPILCLKMTRLNAWKLPILCRKMTFCRMDFSYWTENGVMIFGYYRGNFNTLQKNMFTNNPSHFNCK